MDNNEIAADFLISIGRTGACPELADKCALFIFFMEGFHQFDTISEICPQTCDLCPGKEKHFARKNLIICLAIFGCEIPLLALLRHSLL
jgi:hypothetical protein